jgi:hypothetical protein
VPHYFGNLLNSFSFKGFSLSFNIVYKFDYYVRKSTINYYSLFNGWRGHIDFADRWQKPGDEKWTSVPSMTYPADSRRDNFYASSEINVERGDNIRVADVRVGFPEIQNKKQKIVPFKTLQFFFSPRSLNLIIWKANKSRFDPDYSGTSFQLPPSREWAAGVNVTF